MLMDSGPKTEDPTPLQPILAPTLPLAALGAARVAPDSATPAPDLSPWCPIPEP